MNESTGNTVCADSTPTSSNRELCQPGVQIAARFAFLQQLVVSQSEDNKKAFDELRASHAQNMLAQQQCAEAQAKIMNRLDDLHKKQEQETLARTQQDSVIEGKLSVWQQIDRSPGAKTGVTVGGGVTILLAAAKLVELFL